MPKNITPKLPKSSAPVDPVEGLLDDDATPADAGWAAFSEEEFLKGEKGGKKRAADDLDEEKEEEASEDDDELDGFGIEDEE
jgi:hypothetical protein